MPPARRTATSCVIHTVAADRAAAVLPPPRLCPIDRSVDACRRVDLSTRERRGAETKGRSPSSAVVSIVHSPHCCGTAAGRAEAMHAVASLSSLLTAPSEQMTKAGWRAFGSV